MVIPAENDFDSFQVPDGMLNGLSIDNLIFGLNGSQLEILLIKRGTEVCEGEWGLPGGWIKHDEDLHQAAYRLLKNLTGVEEAYLDQLRVFGKVDRYPLGRVVTVAYYALIRACHYDLVAGLTASDAAWFNIRETPRLVFDHQEIVDFGIEYLRQQVRRVPIGFNLLPEKFTLLQLQELYETILDVKLDKPNFRRKILKMNFLSPCNEKQQGVAHRAANLYEFDTEAYEKLTQQGFLFEV